ncbi:CCA tRNA nucleotidyltransferase [Alicyclobacillus kakegawensis]|uniref:CCA tRNA nucleotidyltransferase n=1 Tax=Alicyclobacillus kakegawensis TaxID=392012 RepID=UPI00082E9D8B|nr:hypothetical protein [Alicyclobacillus kakegawensis]
MTPPCPRLPELPDDVAGVMRTLLRHGSQAYLVGGCVRDGLRGQPVHDYDIATDARPDRIQQWFPRTFATGLRHGTVTVWTGKRPVEVTTFRTESAYSDGRRPDRVTFTDDLAQDLARRDFTVNAMAADVSGRIIDPFGGLSDLAQKCLRAVGDARHRFAEDGLRIVRALRFVSQLGFTIEPQTLDAMHQEARRLRSVSSERLGQEMRRMVQTQWWLAWPLCSAGPWLTVYPHPWPKWQRAMREQTAAVGTTEAAKARFGQRWQTVLLDLGWQHQWAAVSAWMFWLSRLTGASADETVEAVRRFAWPKQVGRDVQDMMSLAAEDPVDWSDRAWREALFGRPAALVGWVCFVCDALSPVAGNRLAMFRDRLRTQPLHRLSELAVNGHDVAALGLRGEQVGSALRMLAEAVLQGEIENQRRPLLQWLTQRLPDLHASHREGGNLG